MAKFLWTQRSDFGPAPRAEHAMAFDSQRGRTVLFGGVGMGEAPLGDTWEWDGSFWTQMDDSGPGPRSGHAMVYDSAKQVSILFGGFSPAADSPVFGDTWQWDGQDWTQLANSGPIPRGAASMVFDSIRNRTVLFGGSAPVQQLLDTWEFDGQEWTQEADTGPQVDSPAMAFDSTGARVLLFDSTAVRTWSWNGASWIQIAGFGPPSRISTAITAAASSIVLFGGGGRGDPVARGDSWRFDGEHWTQIQNFGPAPRFGHALTFDSIRDAVVLFGGTDTNIAILGDTWEHI